jgi:hypothetical protein
MERYMSRSSGRPGSLDIEPGRFHFDTGFMDDPVGLSLSFRTTDHENGQERRSVMQAQASTGLWELLIWIVTGSGLLGLPPGERDLALLKAVPPQTVLYFEWAARGDGVVGATGVDGFAADAEIRQFFELFNVALTKLDEASHEAHTDEDESGPLHHLRPLFPQLAKLISAHPGCFFAGFEPPPPNNANLPTWLRMLAGVHGGLILSSGNDTDQLWGRLNQSLESIPGFKFNENSLTQSIPISIPGYTLVVHREGQRIVFALGNGTLARITDGLSGRPPGLDTNGVFRKSLERVNVPRIGTIGWVDGKGLVTSIIAGLGPVGFLVRPILAMTGADAVDHIVHLSGVENGEMIQRTFVATGGRTDGIMVLAAGSPIQAQQFAHVPADADMVLATSISLSRVFQESRRLLESVQPLSVRVFDEAVKQLESELELKIIEDVLPAFGDVLVAFDSPSAGGMIATSLVVSLEVRDPRKAAVVFDRLMILIEQSLTGEHPEMDAGEPVSLRRQSFLNQSIFYVNTSGTIYSGRIAITPTFCLSEKHLLFAVHPQAMKAQLRHIQSKRPGFDQLASRKVMIPAGETLSYGYLNGPRASHVVGSLLPYIGHVFLNRLEEGGISMDSYSLPSTAAISPYFSDSTAVVTRQKDGLFIEARNAPPVLVGLTLLSLYRDWSATEFELLDVFRRQKANGAQQAQLGRVENAVIPAVAEKKDNGPAKEKEKANPAVERKLAPLILKALVPDGMQQLIPDSALRKLEEGPSPAAIQRREEARRLREERRQRRINPPR